jgi:hypothetical protein
MLELIRIYFLSIRRDPSFEDKFVLGILTSVSFIYFFISTFILGFFLDIVLRIIKPQTDPIDTFSSFFLFLFVADILLKFFVKSYKQVDVLPYLTLPITRKKVCILLFVKELLSKWNFIWVVFLTPFFFKTVYPANGLASALLLIFSVYLICVTISFVIRYSVIQSIWKSFLYNLFPLLLAVCIMYVAYCIAVAPQIAINIDLLFSQYKTEIFVGLLAWFLSLYILFLKSCKYEIYSLLSNKKNFTLVFNFRWLQQFGIIGEIITLCLKEILRSRYKQRVLSVFLFLIVGLCLFKEGNFLVQCCIALLPTILLGRIYGESTYNVESTFFEKLMVSPQNIPYLILKSKYAICVIHAAFNTIISIMVCTNRVPILFWISTFFFGCGILLFFIFQNVVYNNQRFDISDSIRKHSDITSFSLLMMVFVTILVGFIIVTIKGLMSETTAEYVMLTAGIAGMLTAPFWLRNIYKRFLTRKYQNINGFRNS